MCVVLPQSRHPAPSPSTSTTDVGSGFFTDSSLHLEESTLEPAVSSLIRLALRSDSQRLKPLVSPEYGRVLRTDALSGLFVGIHLVVGRHAPLYQTMIRSLCWRDDAAESGALLAESLLALAMRVLVDIQSTSREASQPVDSGHVALQAAPHL